VSIVDVRLPPTLTDEGLRAAVDARRATPGLPVLVLSQHVEELYARELLAESHGAIGYLLKDRVFSDDQFLDAVRAVAGGGTVMDPPVQRRPLRRASHTSRRSSTNSTCRHPTRANRRVLAVLEYLGA
jgi:DNA-binding NarL/FixJ family response regulator